jgi:hypothetical protein
MKGKTMPKEAGAVGAHDDREMIQNPATWPNWPFLPMVNRSGKERFSDHGLILACEDKKRWPNEKIIPVVVYINLFSALPQVPNNTMGYLLDHSPKQEYASMDALLADGWVID